MPKRTNILLARAHRVLAGGPATLSKHPSRFPAGLSPLFLDAGNGAYVCDVDGNEYIDCIGALGPVLLGHAHPGVTAAVQHQAGMLASSSMSTRLEVEVAEQLVEMIPVAEQVRFCTNGYDATNAAIKLARYITGKQHVIFCGYHGQSDSYLITTDKAGGILPQIQPYNHQVPWRDSNALYDALGSCYRSDHAYDLAAIILEVPPEPYGLQRSETRTTLLNYQKAARDRGALFILDEVVTWGRYGMGGAQAFYDVQADLVCLSKALGNGYPIAAITGPRDLMRAFEGGQVFLSTTFGANPISLAACQAVLKALAGEYPSLVEHGTAFLDDLVEICSGWCLPVNIRGMHGRIVMDWQDCNGVTAAQLKTLWMQEMITHGVLVSVVFLPMTVWDKPIVEKLLWEAIDPSVEIISNVIRGKTAIEDALRCPVITESFQRYERQG